jgi:hypothetical protein
VHKGLLMTFAPKAGHESDVEQFLRGGREIVEEEDGTLAGHVPRELAKHAASLLGSVPDMDKCDVLAAKLAD